MKIQAVLFDLDNTLTHRDQSVVVYAQRFLNDFSHHLATSELEKPCISSVILTMVVILKKNV